MTENSPVIPSESRILGVRVFPATNDQRSSNLDSRTLSTLSLSTVDSETGKTVSNEFQKSLCQCPEILIADDDPFQVFFYEVLFQRSISWKEIVGTEESVRFEIFQNGESLLRRFNVLQECGCGKPVLIISDYNMGLNNIDGVDVIASLRNSGYKGFAILRTSEEEEDIKKSHPEFSDMMRLQMITSFLDKQNAKNTREKIQELMRKRNSM